MNGDPKPGDCSFRLTDPWRLRTALELRQTRDPRVAVGQFSYRSVDDDRDAWIVLFLGGVDGLDESTGLLAAGARSRVQRLTDSVTDSCLRTKRKAPPSRHALIQKLSIPEPGTYALMLAGRGLLGAAGTHASPR